MSNIVTTLMARTGIANLLGMQMGGARDLYKTFGWKIEPKFQDYLFKWKRQAIARRVVNAYPDALWADPPIVEGDATFQAAWQQLLSEQPVFPMLQKLDKLCRIGKFAVMVVGLNDGASLSTQVSPVRDVSKTRKVIYLQPYAECSVDIKEYEQNPTSPRYGLPTVYTISPGEFDNLLAKDLKTTAGALKSFTVHWSRILHVSENALESPVFGSSCLEPIFNDLDDLIKISGGSAEVFWLNSNRGLHIDVDKEMELKNEDAEALDGEIADYANNLQRVMRTRGVKVTSLGTDFLDPRNVYDVAVSNISAATGIPKKVLSGSEAGQLASQQDRANWSLRVDERVSEYGNPTVLMPFLRMLIDCQVMPIPQTMTVKWPDAFKMSPLERAQTSAQMARTASNLAKTLFTVEQMNHTNALDATSQPAPAAGGFGFGANAGSDPSKSSSGTSKTPNPGPSNPGDPGNTGQQTAPEPAMQPALRPGIKTDYELLTVDECRQIIGFGKHMPVFDESQSGQNTVGSPAPPTPNPTLDPSE